MSARQILEAELTWTGRRFESGVQIAIEEGRIAAVGRELGTTHQRLDRRVAPVRPPQPGRLAVVPRHVVNG